MGKFQDMAKLLKLRKDAKEIQKKLKNIHIEAESENVKVTINAEQRVISVTINDNSIDQAIKSKLELNLAEAFNRGIKKSQEIAAENMKGIMSELQGGIPGLTNNETEAK